MTFAVTFFIPGEAVAKQRPRFTRFGRTYTPKKTHDYEAQVAAIAKSAMGSQEPLETPVMVCVYVTMPIPQSYSKKRTEACLNGSERPIKRNGDLDNQIKSVLDGMNGIVYADDCQITALHATKVYGSTAMVEVYVSEDLE